MPEFRSALNEIYATQNKVILFMTILKSAFVFLCTYFILNLLNFFPTGLGFTIALIYFGVKLHRDVSTKTLIDVERKNPYLSERLRTAADYATTINYVVSRLHLSVLNALKNVRVSSFLDIKRISYLIFGIIIMTGAVLYSSANDLMIYNLRAGLASLSFGDKDLLGDFVPPSVLDADISVEELNENSLINDMSNVAAKKFAPRDIYLPEDIFSASDKSFEEQLPKKKRIYIRKYFGEIRKYGIE